MARTAVKSVVQKYCTCGTSYRHQRHCMSCGGRNPRFRWAAWHAEHTEKDAKFGTDCLNDHIELRASVAADRIFAEKYPCCEDCGYRASP